MMQQPTIANLIGKKNALLDKGRTGSLEAATKHRDASIQIANHYRAFESIRPKLYKGRLTKRDLTPVQKNITDAMLDVGLLQILSNGALRTHTPDARRYVMGGWLEEVSCLAARECGADEVKYSQVIQWDIGGYSGENEIDVIARYGTRLAFYSCKAYGASYRRSNDLHRKKLRDALHEADNLMDHFGDSNAYVGLILSTDLYDEFERKPKYEALFGKAKALKVDLITLEELRWEKLVRAMGRANPDD